MNRLLLIIWVAFPLSMQGQKSLEYWSGQIPAATVWSADTIVITGNIFVPCGVILTIEPNVLVIVDSASGFYVDGHIHAIGHPEYPVIFTIPDTTGFWDTNYAKDVWKGIRFEPESSGADSSVFEYCQIGYSRSSPESQGIHGGIFLEGRQRVRISNCLIHNHDAKVDGGGLVCITSSPIVENSDFHSNRAGNYGGGLYIDTCTLPLITGNRILKNQSRVRGGGIYSHISSAIIQGNTIADNKCFYLIPGIPASYGGEGAGIYLDDYYGGATVINNIIIMNQSAGAAIYESTYSSVIAGNLIANNAFIGIMAGNSFSQSRYYNNTIALNHGAAAILAGGFQQWENNILWNNSTAYPLANLHFLTDTPWVSYSFMNELFTGPGTGNIQGNPGFMSPCPVNGLTPLAWSADWRLKPGSVCIDAGNPSTTGMPLPVLDLDGNQRIAGGRIDMGAYEFPQTQGVAEAATARIGGLFPNPCRAHPQLRLEDKGGGQVWLFDILGHLVYQGHHYDGDELPLSGLDPGIYFYRIRSRGGYLFSKKWIKQ